MNRSQCKLTVAMKKTLGARIRELREAKDLSLRELARKLDDISAAHLSDIELGRRFPSEELLGKLAKKLEIPLEELREHDARPPVEDIKKMIQNDPAYGIALRKLVNKKVSAEDILKLAEKRPDRDRKK